jgi:N-acetylglucosamine-6-phosphate deacetylase
MQLRGHLLTPTGFVRGTLDVSDGRIRAIDGDAVTEQQVRAAADVPLWLPGFIDLHLHGGGGADTMDAGDAIDTIARLHALHGTTSLLATTMTAPMADIEAALRAVAPAVAQRRPGAARVLGVHLEGPYIHPDRLGAQPAYARLPQLAEIQALMALAPIRVITLAPECEGALALIPALVQAGLRVQIGHSAASYEQACAALQARCQRLHAPVQRHGGLPPPRARCHRRGAGACRAGRADPDLLHVQPGAMLAALRAIPACMR